MSVYSEMILNELLKATSLRMAVIDSKGIIKLASDGFTETFPELIDSRAEEGNAIRFDCLDKADILQRAITESMPVGNMISLVLQFPGNNGTSRVEVNLTELKFPDLEPVFLTEWIPVNESRDIEVAFLESEKRYRTLQENLPVGIYRADEGGLLKAANSALLEMMGYDSFQDLQKVPLEDVWVNPEQRLELINILREQGSVTGYQVLLRKKSGGELIGSFDARGTFDSSGSLLYFDTIVQDITSRLLDKRELERLARTDSLTGLFNRQHLMERICSEAARSRRYGHPLGLMLIDLDRFKLINDTFGHLVGDDVLVSSVSHITDALRDTDFAGRYGGEEFCVVLPETDLKGSKALAERIRKKMANFAFTLPEGDVLRVTCSIGVAVMRGESSASDLIFQADNALYEAKREGRNKVIISGDRS